MNFDHLQPGELAPIFNIGCGDGNFAHHSSMVLQNKGTGMPP